MPIRVTLRIRRPSPSPSPIFSERPPNAKKQRTTHIPVISDGSAACANNNNAGSASAFALFQKSYDPRILDKASTKPSNQITSQVSTADRGDIDISSFKSSIETSLDIDSPSNQDSESETPHVANGCTHIELPCEEELKDDDMSQTQNSVADGPAENTIRKRNYKYPSWDERFNELVAFKRTNGHTNVIATSQLGKWITGQRRKYRLLREEDPQRVVVKFQELEKILGCPRDTPSDPSTSPSSSSTSPRTNKKIKKKKHPDAPRRFKSAFIFFSCEKHKEIRNTSETVLKTTSVAKMVSEAWKDISPQERSIWDLKAKNDKTRYEHEKATYTGPWEAPPKIDVLKLRRPKTPFQAFSAAKRKFARKLHPEKRNREISLILWEMWREAPQKEQRIYIDEQDKLRKAYKATDAEMRAKVAKDFADEHQIRERLAFLAQSKGTAQTIAPGDNRTNHTSVMCPSGIIPYHVYPHPGQGYVNPNEHGHNSMAPGRHAFSQAQSYQCTNQQSPTSPIHEWSHANFPHQTPYDGWNNDESTRQQP